MMPGYEEKKMNEKETVNTTVKTAENKKHYTSPKIEMIGEVKDATRGSTINNTDAGGQGANVPSDPGW